MARGGSAVGVRRSSADEEEENEEDFGGRSCVIVILTAIATIATIAIATYYMHY